MSDKKLVEACLERVEDGFQLVVFAAYRAQELAAGVMPLVARETNKDTVVSLREIASGALDLDTLRERIVVSMQQFSFLNAPTKSPEDSVGGSR